MKRNDEEEGDTQEVSEEEKEKFELIEAESRQVYDPHRKTVNLNNRRVTDLKENPKVYLPKPLKPVEEAQLAVRKEKYLEVFQKYVEANCNKKGEQKLNLSFGQRRGLEKLLKRIQEKEIIVLMTDKTGKLAVISREEYLRMGEVHTSKDIEIGWGEAAEIQKLTNGHTSSWIKIAGVGESWGHVERVRETCLNKSICIASMYLLYKDHKETKTGEVPKSRPVVSSSGGMGIHLNNILSEFVEPLADNVKGKIEVISSEEMMNKFDRLNKLVEIQEEKLAAGEEIQQHIDLAKSVLTGADAVALYPSLLKKTTAMIVRKEAMDSEIKWQGINYLEAARYVAINLEPWEVRSLGLERIVPRRRFRKGCKPGLTGRENMSKYVEDEIRWEFPNLEATEQEKRILVAVCLEIGVRAVFDLHTYQFGGKLYLQSDGGPIGLRLTGACAKVVMAQWSVKVSEILERSHVEIWLSGGYIDDIRYLTSRIDSGWRYNKKENRITYSEEWEEEDEKLGYSQEKKTSAVILEVMNSINKELTFTTEIPEEFENKRLPTLDFEMWVDRGEKPRVRYSFFEKPMNSKFCVMANGAMADNMKKSTLSQEIVRRMLNTSEEQPQDERNRIIEKFIVKMQVSGYNEKQVQDIVLAGLKGYENKKSRAEKNGSELHRDSKSTMGSRVKKKLMAKNNWFKTKKNKKEIKARPGEPAGWTRDTTRKRDTTTKNNEEKPPTTVIFVPRTPHGELARLLRDVEAEMQKFTKTRVKIVEETGDMVKSLVTRSNPWAGEKCSRGDCPVCSYGEKQGDCRKRNLVYKTQCLVCKEQGREALYVGETARTAYERGREHHQDRRSHSEKSHMYCHSMEEHSQSEEQPQFSMKVYKTHRSALARQIHEAVVIANSWDIKLLNSKSEYNRCIIPRISVMVGQKEDTGSKITERDALEWEENTRRKKRDTREEQASGRAAKRCKRWHREATNWGKRAGEQQDGAAKKKRKTVETRAAERFRSWFTSPRRSGIQEAEEQEKQGEPEQDAEQSQPEVKSVKSVKRSNQFKKLREMFEEKKQENSSQEPNSSENEAVQPKSQNQKVMKSIATKKPKNMPVGAYQTPPRKKAIQPKVLSSKVKKTTSKGEIKGGKVNKKGVQDIRNFFESGEEKTRSLAFTAVHVLAHASSPVKNVQDSSWRGIKGNSKAQPRELNRSMGKCKGSDHLAIQHQTGLASSNGQD